MLAEISPGEAWITSSPFYKGNLVYLGLDYSRIPESIRIQFASYGNEIIFPSVPGAPVLGWPYRSRLENNPRLQKDLYDIPGWKLPDMKWFALSLFGLSAGDRPDTIFRLMCLDRECDAMDYIPAHHLCVHCCRDCVPKLSSSEQGQYPPIGGIESFRTQTRFLRVGLRFRTGLHTGSEML